MTEIVRVYEPQTAVVVSGGEATSTQIITTGVASVNGKAGPVTLNADDIGATMSRIWMSPAERTKLAGIAAEATKNAADSFLISRSNHTGTQAASTISDFSEAVDDRVAALMRVANGLTLTYDDTAGTLTVGQQVGLVNLKDYGATGDGSTNDAPAIQNAINAAAALGLKVYVPKGRYRIPNTTQIICQGIANLHIVGDGMNESVFFFDDDAQTSTRRDCFRGSSLNPCGDVTFEKFAIESTWGAAGNYTQRSHLVEIFVTGDVLLDRCRFSGSRFMSTVFNSGRRGEAKGCFYENGRRDGCRFVDFEDVEVHSNFFKGIIDDAIAVHSTDGAAEPARQHWNIHHNTMVDSQGIAAHGIRAGSIHHNTIIRPHVRGIEIGGDGSGGLEGNTPALGVSIENNVILDAFKGSSIGFGLGDSLYWIRVTSRAPTLVSGGYVGMPNGSGGIVQPWDYFYDNNTDAGVHAGNWFVKVQGNQCIRTLTTAAKYSDYGFGQRLGPNGIVDPAITSASIGGEQILIQEHAFNTTICDNICWGGSRGVYLNGTSGSAYASWINVTVQNNKIGNFTDTGIYYEGEGNVLVEGNDIDGDPLHVHPNRLANGKWQASPIHYAWRNNGGTIATVRNNHVRNCGRTTGGSATDFYLNNIFYCNPVSEADNADNQGIRNGHDAYYGICQIEGSDPASPSTYGKIINICPTQRSAVPTTGTYVRGHFIWNTQPATSTTLQLLGWRRLTTGSSHIIGTDWMPVNVPHVSADGLSYGFGIAAPTARIHIRENNSNTTVPQMRIEQQGTGDATAMFTIVGTRAWQFGIDNSDGDKFKISSQGDGFASGVALEIDPVTLQFSFLGVSKLASYAVAGLPAAAAGNTGGVVYCSNGNAGSPCLAVSTGSSWLRVPLGAAVSAT